MLSLFISRQNIHLVSNGGVFYYSNNLPSPNLNQGFNIAQAIKIKFSLDCIKANTEKVTYKQKPKEHKNLKRGPGRPRKLPKTGTESRAAVQENIRAAAERRLGIHDIDVDEFVHTVSDITGKQSFTREEMTEIRERLHLLYQKFVTDKHEEEAIANAPFIDAACKAAVLKDVGTRTKQMSKEEWVKEHCLRSNLKHLKPCPPKKKKIAVRDLTLGERGTASSPDAVHEFDTEAAKAEYIQVMMDQHIAQRKEEAQFLKGKHFRRDEMPIRLAEYRRDFWI